MTEKLINSEFEKNQRVDLHILFGFLATKIMAGEIYDERSLNQFINNFSERVEDGEELRIVFNTHLVNLLEGTLIKSSGENTRFPIVNAMLTYLEDNYIDDIHLGNFSKNLGSIINKWLKYSSSIISST